MIRIYEFGRGGRHTRRAEARAWRQLTAQIAQSIADTHPRWKWELIIPRAEAHAREIAHAYNRRIVDRTMEGV
jgi:hypothetical protein